MENESTKVEEVEVVSVVDTNNNTSVENNDRNKELIFTILFIIPIVGPILYLVLVKPTDVKKILTIVGIIPAVNLIMFVLLILDFFDVIKLNK